MSLAAFLGAFAAGVFAGAGLILGLERCDRKVAILFGGFSVACLVPAILLAVLS